MWHVHGSQHPRQGPQGPATSRSVGALGRGRRTRAALRQPENRLTLGKTEAPRGKIYPENSAVVLPTVRDHFQARARSQTRFTSCPAVQDLCVVVYHMVSVEDRRLCFLCSVDHFVLKCMKNFVCYEYYIIFNRILYTNLYFRRRKLSYARVDSLRSHQTIVRFECGFDFEMHIVI